MALSPDVFVAAIIDETATAGKGLGQLRGRGYFSSGLIRSSSSSNDIEP
jgi:hypothetical protein